MSEQNDSQNTDLPSAVEALLFVAGEAVTASQLSTALDVSTREVEQALSFLASGYEQRGGMAIQQTRGKYLLTTAARYAELVERFLGLEASSRFSQAALETMTIVCYRQPITRPGIDAIRGVSSDGVLRSLVSKGLVEEVGRAEGPGRPILYATTNEFLQHFGINSIEELPPYKGDDDVEEANGNQLLKD
jgi:segregation and condensation protein B